MSDVISLEFLATVPLFRLLDEDELKALREELTVREIAGGARIFEFGQTGQEMYVIESGEIELTVRDTTGQVIPLARLKNGEMFGELSTFDGGPRSASAQATVPTRLMVLSRQRLLDFLEAHPQAALDLLAVYAQRLRETDRILMSRVSRNFRDVIETKLSLFQRMAGWIADFSGSMPFLIANALIFFFWIVTNVDLIPGLDPFDPYPFGLLTMWVSLEAIFLSIFVLLAQNVQTARDQIRGDIEYEVNLKAELEVAELHQKMDQLQVDIVKQFRELQDSLGNRSGHGRIGVG